MSDKTDKIKIAIARYAVLFGTRMRKLNGAELSKMNAALNLLNQAQMIASVSDNEARKLLALARNIANQGAQDESTKRPAKSRINENRKESPPR